MKFFTQRDQNFNELLKGSSISLFLKVSGMLLNYAAMLFITNHYGAEEWGIYSLCFTVLSIAILLPKFGFDNSLVRIITELNTFKNKAEIKNVIYKSLLVSSIISLFVAIMLNQFSDIIVFDILNQESIQPYIKLISYTILPTVILVIVSATFQALKKTVLFMLFQATLTNLLFLLLLLIDYFLDSGTTVFKLYFYAVCIVMVIGIILSISVFKGTHTNVELQKTYTIKSISKISLPMLLSSSFALLMGWSDIIMLSYFKTTKDIGIYNSSLKLAALAGITLIAINAIATPKFVEFYAKRDFDGLKDIVKKSTKMIFYATTPILIVLVLFSKKILGLFGEEFEAGYMALIVLCIASFINAISGSVGYIMQMTDQQKTYQYVIMISFFINLVLNLFLIPNYSFNGAAIASSVAMVFWNLCLVVIIKRKLGFWTIYIPFLVK
ncbi:MAG: flippase [Gelidibacter sp.]